MTSAKPTRRRSPKYSTVFQTIRSGLAESDPVLFAATYANVEFPPGQEEYYRRVCSLELQDRNVIGLVCRKGGKTKGLGIAYAYLFKQNPTLKIFHLSGSYLQASRLYEPFKPLVTNPEIFPNALVDEPTKFFTHFKAGGVLEIATTSVKSARSGDYDIMSIDEAVLLEPEIIEAAWPLVRASKIGKRIVVSTASPGPSWGWFVNLWQRASELEFKRCHWSSAECPWLNRLDQTDAEKLWGIDSEFIKVEYEGEISERAGFVFDGRIVDDSLVEPPQISPRSEDTQRGVGHDWGFSHPSVTIEWELQGETIIVRDVLIRQKIALSAIIEDMATKYRDPTVPIYPDSAGAHENDMLNRMGLRVTPVNFGKDKDTLIGQLRWRLEKGLIKIPNPKYASKDMKKLVDQLKNYSYDQNGKPRKGDDDCVDALLASMKPFIDLPIRRTGVTLG